MAARAVGVLLLAGAIATAPARGSAAASAPPPTLAREYQVKAAFLFNFVQFVEWPPAAFSSEDAPFCIAVLGNDPFGPDLEDVIRGEQAGGHPLTVKHVRRVEDAQGCQMLFVSRSEWRRVGDLLARVREWPTLTVADIPGFAESGGIIGFDVESNRVRLQVNLGAAQNAQLKINSKLLRSAQIVSW